MQLRFRSPSEPSIFSLGYTFSSPMSYGTAERPGLMPDIRNPPRLHLTSYRPSSQSPGSSSVHPFLLIRLTPGSSNSLPQSPLSN